MNLNFTAPINSTSYGIVGKNLLREFSARTNVSFFPIANIECDQQFGELINKTHYSINHPDFSAPSLRLWHQFDLAQHVGTKRISYTIFELDRLAPHEEIHCRAQDAIITSSSYHCDVLLRHGCNAHFVPLGVDRNIFNEFVAPANIREPLKLNDGTTIFIHVGKAEYRKGADVIKTTFEKAFSVKDNVALILLTYNPFLITHDQQGRVIKDGNQEWFNYYKGSTLGTKFHFLGRQPTQNHIAAIMQAADCVLCPSRAEGFNFELCEALSIGKHVIATDCTAHADYERDAFRIADTNLLVEMGDAPTESAVDGTQFFKGQGNWFAFGEKQIGDLAAKIRFIHDFRQQNGPLPRNTRGVEFAKTRNWENTANSIMEIING